LSRYRSLEELYNQGTSSHYRKGSLDNYYSSKHHQKPYRNPVGAKRYPKPIERGRRGKLPYPKPNYFQSQKPEKKYESVLKLENMGSPSTGKTPRYTIENPHSESWVDAEQIAKDIEKRLDSKMTERFLENFSADLEELMRRFGKVENVEKPTEQRPEQKQDVEGHVEMQNDGGQKVDREKAKVESKNESSDIPEESKEVDMPLDGGFKVSRAFGIAIPTEVEEQDKEEITDKESETDQSKVETVENEPQLDENREQEEIEDLEVEGENEVETKGEPEETENSEGDVESAESEDSSVEPTQTETTIEGLEIEIAPQDVTETDEMMSEPLPEETELYPVEEPQEVEVI